MQRAGRWRGCIWRVGKEVSRVIQHLTPNYLLSIYYMLGSVVGIRVMVVNKVDKLLFLESLGRSVIKQLIKNKITSDKYNCKRMCQSD